MYEPNTITTKLKINSGEEIDVPLHFESDNFLPALLAQHMLVQGTSDNILVGFYDGNPPIMINPTPEAIESLKQEGYVAECVARIAIPISRFGEFAKVFNEIARHITFKESEKSDANSE